MEDIFNVEDLENNPQFLDNNKELIEKCMEIGRELSKVKDPRLAITNCLLMVSKMIAATIAATCKQGREETALPIIMPTLSMMIENDLKEAIKVK